MYRDFTNPSLTLPKISTLTSHHQTLPGSGKLSSYTSPEHPHTPSFNHLAGGYTLHTLNPESGKPTLTWLQTLSVFVNKIFSKFTKHAHQLFNTNTLAPPYLLPPPPLTSVPVDLSLSGHQILQSRATPYFQPPATPIPTTFSVYIQQLNQWEYRLLHDSLITTDILSLSETFQNNPQIIAASDGSVTSSVGAYGWICSLPHSQRLATNHGPVFSSLPSSFHAEAYGLLSYLRFLYHVSHHTHSSLPMETIIYTDSASLIAKINKIEKRLYFSQTPQWTQTGTSCNKSLPADAFSLRSPYLSSSKDTKMPIAPMQPCPSQLN